MDHTDQLLREQLDASFGDGPPLASLTDTLHAGHRAVRRRRLATGAGALAVVTVLGVGGFLAVGNDGEPRGKEPAFTDSQAATDAFADEVPPGLPDSCERLPEPCDSMPVDYTPGGDLRRLQGVAVTALVLDPVLRGDTGEERGRRGDVRRRDVVDLRAVDP